MKRNISLNESEPVDKNSIGRARNILILIIGSMLVISSGIIEIIL